MKKTDSRTEITASFSCEPVIRPSSANKELPLVLSVH